MTTELLRDSAWAAATACIADACCSTHTHAHNQSQPTPPQNPSRGPQHKEAAKMRRCMHHAVCYLHELLSHEIRVFGSFGGGGWWSRGWARLATSWYSAGCAATSCRAWGQRSGRMVAGHRVAVAVSGTCRVHSSTAAQQHSKQCATYVSKTPYKPRGLHVTEKKVSPPTHQTLAHTTYLARWRARPRCGRGESSCPPSGLPPCGPLWSAQVLQPQRPCPLGTETLGVDPSPRQLDGATS